VTASLSDILTTQKNGVVAINGLKSVFQSIADSLTIIAADATNSIPSKSSTTVVATTAQAVVGSGILLGVSIPASSGANQVLIYDSATIGGAGTSNLIYGSLPANASAFVPYRDVRIRYTNGLVVAAGTSMSCVVSYTPSA
jgi:hypothetical protein